MKGFSAKLGSDQIEGNGNVLKKACYPDTSTLSAEPATKLPTLLPTLSALTGC